MGIFHIAHLGNPTAIKHFQSEEEQQKEYEIIVGKSAAGLSTELSHEYSKNQKAHSMASDSNATLDRAMKLHIDNLKLLSQPLPVLQSMVVSMVDIDEDSEASITEVNKYPFFFNFVFKNFSRNISSKIKNKSSDSVYILSF